MSEEYTTIILQILNNNHSYLREILWNDGVFGGLFIFMCENYYIRTNPSTELMITVTVTVTIVATYQDNVEIWKKKVDISLKPVWNDNKSRKTIYEVIGKKIKGGKTFADEFQMSENIPN